MERPPADEFGVLANRPTWVDVPVEIDRWIDHWVEVTDDPLDVINLPALWAHIRQVSRTVSSYRHFRDWLIIALVTRGAIPVCSSDMRFQWLRLRMVPRVPYGPLKDESI